MKLSLWVAYETGGNAHTIRAIGSCADRGGAEGIAQTRSGRKLCLPLPASDLLGLDFFFGFLWTIRASRDHQAQAQHALAAAFLFQAAHPGFEQVIERDHAYQPVGVVTFNDGHTCEACFG